jgi:hypothetical protein
MAVNYHVFTIVLPGANVMKQNHGNLMPFHGNYRGNIALYAGIIMEWQ